MDEESAIHRIPRSNILLMDCMEFVDGLKDKDSYAVVADPPYGISYARRGQSKNSVVTSRGKGRNARKRIVGDDKPFDPLLFSGFHACAFTGAQHFYSRLPEGGSLHCWDKRGDYKRLTQADADMVWISRVMKSRVFRLVWRGICRHDEETEMILHPTQKPISVMRWMIKLMELPKGMTIFDPYMGSGSTGVAAIQLGFGFVGCEVDPEYFAVAQKRIAVALEFAKQIKIPGLESYD